MTYPASRYPQHAPPYPAAPHTATWVAQPTGPQVGVSQPVRYVVPSPKTRERDTAQVSKVAVLLCFFVFWLVASGLFLALYLDRYLF